MLKGKIAKLHNHIGNKKLNVIFVSFVTLFLLLVLNFALIATFSAPIVSLIRNNKVFAWPTVEYPYYQDNNGYYIQMGHYPQKYVGNSLNSTIETAFNNSQLQATGAVYSTVSTSYDDGVFEEYLYQGEKFVRVKQDHNDFSSGGNYNYSTGDKVGKKGDPKWFRVEPIKWYIMDGTNPSTLTKLTNVRVLCEHGLAGNIVFGGNNIWSNSNLRNWTQQFAVQSGLSAMYDTVIVNETVKNNASGKPTDDNSGSPTQDYIYYPSRHEVESTYNQSGMYLQRVGIAGYPSDFAIGNNAVMNGKGCTDWWLRSAGTLGFSCVVESGGGLGQNAVGNKDASTRPMMTVKLGPELVAFEDEISTDENHPDIYKENAGEKINFYIKSAEGFRVMSDFTNSGGVMNERYAFYLNNHIDMSNNEFTPIVNFNTLFDGQGYSITNLTVTSDHAALFGSSNSGTFANFNILGANVTGTTSAGCLVAQSSGQVTISDVIIEAIISGVASGGLVGTNTGQVNIARVGIVAQVADGGVFGSGNMQITDSYFIGTVMTGIENVNTCAGVYISTDKNEYISGFNNQHWMASSINGGLPTFRNKMAVGSYAPEVNVENILTEKGFSKL